MKCSSIYQEDCFFFLSTTLVCSCSIPYLNTNYIKTVFTNTNYTCLQMLLYVKVTKPKHRIILMDKTFEVQNSLEEKNALLRQAQEGIFLLICRTIHDSLNKNKLFSFFLNKFYNLSSS